MTRSPSKTDGRIDFGAWSAGTEPVPIVVVGHSDVRCWGLSSRERILRLARRRNHPVLDAPGGHENNLICDARYWFEAGLLDWCAATVGRAVMHGDRIVIAHGRASALGECMAGDSAPPPALARRLCLASEPMFFAELSKREAPLVMRLDEQSAISAEWRSFQAAYRGVSDVLTRYCWPHPAFHLTRLAARLGVAPNVVTALGAAFAAAACVAWWHGAFFIGGLAALVFMLLDTVDGKLARCTVRASKVGDVFDHGVDVLFPPLGWLVWAHGAGASAPALFASVLLVGCYLAQRAVEASFIAIAGIQIHHWRPFDSRFKLFTAQRNTLFPLATVGSLTAGPQAALWLALGWSAICLVIHAVRLITAVAMRARGDRLEPWIANARVSSPRLLA